MWTFQKNRIERLWQGLVCLERVVLPVWLFKNFERKSEQKIYVVALYIFFESELKIMTFYDKD